MGQKEICYTYSQAIYFEGNDKVALPFHIDKALLFQKQMRDKIKWQFKYYLIY